VPKIFRLIQNKGHILDKEMYHTFNMGVGMVLIVGLKDTSAIITQLKKLNLNSWVIGKVIKGKKQVEVI
jgi:phosphoribosylformylglycinamidine cyclo-ligase